MAVPPGYCSATGYDLRGCKVALRALVGKKKAEGRQTDSELRGVRLSEAWEVGGCVLVGCGDMGKRGG